jgi:hypothetical protein
VNEDSVASLLAEIEALRMVIAGLQLSLQTERDLNSKLQSRIAELEQAAPPPPPFVKPNQPARPADRPPRHKRNPDHNHGRRYQPPTEIRQQALDNCPACACRLYGNSIARKRQVFELPAPQPVQVIEYQLIKRYCPACEKWREPKLKLDGLVIGQSRFSLRIMALVAWLRTSLRLPVRQIQTYLAQMHQLTLSVGAINDLLDRVAERGTATADAIKVQLRESKVLYMDETGWREDGENGYVWMMTNNDGAIYFEHHKSRAGAVARGLSGAHYDGTLCTDFYAGYNEHACRHQRCWAHLLRDLDKLEEEHGSSKPQLVEWVEAVVELYKAGRELDGRSPPASRAQREVLAQKLRLAAHELGLRWSREPAHPARALCQRLLRHEGELFEYVRQEGVEATNNRAERGIRPLTVARKISGGSRSEGGSKTRMRLQTLFGTWTAQGMDPLTECLRMLGAKTLLPSL